MHQVMVLRRAGPGLFYPDPDAGDGGAYYNASLKSQDSPFNSPGRNAIIRSLWIDQAAGSGNVQIREHDGTTKVAELSTGLGVTNSILFGPDGFRVQGGFSIRVNTYAVSLIITYDVQ